MILVTRFNIGITLVAVCVTVAGCASAPATSHSTPVSSGLPACAPGVLAVFPSTRTSFPEALDALRQTDWVSATTTVLAAPVKAEVSNKARVGHVLVASYPRHLRDRGLGGEATMLMLVDEAGKVTRTHLWKRSGYPELDEAAQSVANRIEFHPATFEGCRVSSVVTMPIVYRSEGMR